MAKVEYVDLIPGLETQYFSGIRSIDRFTYSRVGRKIALYSRKSKKGLTAKSLLPILSGLWAGLSSEQKTLWANAAAENGLNGWQLFVKDTSTRIKNDIPGLASPSTLHQAWVGALEISAPATEIEIVQIHPKFYYISHKVKGKKSMYEPVLVNESLALPVEISINYKPAFVGSAEFLGYLGQLVFGLSCFGDEVGEIVAAYFGNLSFGFSYLGSVAEAITGSAKFFARFWHSYQGLDKFTDLVCNLNTTGDWQNVNATISDLLGFVIRYDLYIQIQGLHGILYIDNVKVNHSGQNWARDSQCNDINQGFTRAFYQIPKNWAGVVVPVGAGFDSVYPAD